MDPINEYIKKLFMHGRNSHLFLLLVNYEKMCYVSSLVEIRLLPKWINTEACSFKIN